MACYIFGAGSFYGLQSRPCAKDYVIAADGGWVFCRTEQITPDLLLGDFDSLHTVPDFGKIERVPVEKDDTDMMLAVKRGLALGHTEFHLYGGMGVSIGRLRPDTIFDYKFVGLSHNTLRGAAGGAVLIAELLYRQGYLD